MQPVGVDTQGTIHVVPDAPIQPEFTSAVADVCLALVAFAGCEIDSVYLYGSVAHGTAIVGQSDLDVTLVLTHPPAASVLQRIAAVGATLEARHPELAKIDIDIGHVDAILMPENHDRWGFWLKHHCRCVYGRDLSVQFALYRPSRDVARAVNGDFAEVLHAYAQRLAAETSPQVIHRLKKEAARKLVRSTNVLRTVDTRSWPKSLQEHMDQCLLQYPEKTPEMQYFYACATHAAAQDCDELFVTRLLAMADWMQQQMETDGA